MKKLTLSLTISVVVVYGILAYTPAGMIVAYPFYLTILGLW